MVLISRSRACLSAAVILKIVMYHAAFPYRLLHLTNFIWKITIFFSNNVSLIPQTHRIKNYMRYFYKLQAIKTIVKADIRVGLFLLSFILHSDSAEQFANGQQSISILNKN